MKALSALMLHGFATCCREQKCSQHRALYCLLKYNIIHVPGFLVCTQVQNHRMTVQLGLEGPSGVLCPSSSSKQVSSGVRPGHSGLELPAFGKPLRMEMAQLCWATVLLLSVPMGIGFPCSHLELYFGFLSPLTLAERSLAQ